MIKNLSIIMVVCLVLSDSFIKAQQPSEDETAYHLYLTQIAASEAFFQLNLISTARDYLDACNPEYRDLEWHFLDACLDQSDTSISLPGLPSFSDVKMSPDGKMIAICGSDSLVTLLSYPDLELIRQLRGHSGQVSTICFNGDGTGLFSGGRDHSVILWRTGSGQIGWKNDSAFSKGIYQVRYEPEFHLLGVASWELDPSRDPQVVGFAKIMDGRTGHELKKIQNNAHPTSGIVFQNLVTRFIISSWGEIAYCYDTRSGLEIWKYDLSDPSEYNAFHSITLSPDGKKLLLGSTDHRIHILDPENGSLLHRVEPQEGHSKTIKALAFSPDGNYFASAGEDQTIFVWDASTYKKLFSLPGHTKTVTSICWSGDGKSILSVSLDGTLKRWNLEQPFITSYEICDYGPWQTPLTPDKKYFAAPCSDEKLIMYEARTGKPVVDFGSQPALSADFSSDGKILATGDFNGYAKIWDVADGKWIDTYLGTGSRIDGIALLNSIFTFVFVNDTALIVSRLDSGEGGFQIIIPEGPFRVEASPDETRVFVGCSNGAIKVIETKEWTELAHFNARAGLQEMAVSPDGNLLAVFSGKNIEIFNLESFERKFLLAGHEMPGYGLGFSEDCRYLISGSNDQTFKLWNLENGQCTLTYYGFKETIYSTKCIGENELLLGSPQGMMYYINY